MSRVKVTRLFSPEWHDLIVMGYVTIATYNGNAVMFRVDDDPSAELAGVDPRKPGPTLKAEAELAT